MLRASTVSSHPFSIHRSRDKKLGVRKKSRLVLQSGNAQESHLWLLGRTPSIALPTQPQALFGR
jgi:hypothetical protein